MRVKRLSALQGNEAMIFDLNDHMKKRERLHDPVRDRIWKRAEMETAKHEADIHLHIKQIEMEKAELAYRRAIRARGVARKTLDIKTRALAAFDEGTRAYIDQHKKG